MKISEVLSKCPTKKNYGYWTDNELKLEDFRNSFNVEEIDRNCFNEKWNELV